MAKISRLDEHFIDVYTACGHGAMVLMSFP
jgi:hypothetical protein